MYLANKIIDLTNSKELQRKNSKLYNIYKSIDEILYE